MTNNTPKHHRERNQHVTPQQLAKQQQQDDPPPAPSIPRQKNSKRKARASLETPRIPPGDFNPIVHIAILRPIAPCRGRTCRRTRSLRAPELKRQPPNCAKQVWTARRCQSLPAALSASLSQYGNYGVVLIYIQQMFLMQPRFLSRIFSVHNVRKAVLA